MFVYIPTKYFLSTAELDYTRNTTEEKEKYATFTNISDIAASREVIVNVIGRVTAGNAMTRSLYIICPHTHTCVNIQLHKHAVVHIKGERESLVTIAS